jgi:DNA-binding response OmpR family regulator
MKKRVLIFEDDMEILEISKTILEARGYEVFFCSHCKNILELVNTLRPHLVLMDYIIPEGDGIKAVRLLKSRLEWKNIPVIFFSAHEEIENLAFKAGADNYIAKPFDINYLEYIVDTHVAREMRA